MKDGLVIDAAGVVFQWIEGTDVPLSDPGMPGVARNVETSRISGWYDVACRPVEPGVVRHAVHVFYRRESTPTTGTPTAEARA